MVCYRTLFKSVLINFDGSPGIKNMFNFPLCLCDLLYGELLDHTWDLYFSSFPGSL